MHIPLHKPYWGQKEEKAIIRAMREGSGVADGPESQILRNKLSLLTGATHALPVTSATSAMDMAVWALGAKAGDEVIVPSFTLASTATAAMIKGARPVFADIDPATYCLDPRDVERVISKKTVGIITVHYAGMAGKGFLDLIQLAKAHNLWLVEDAAHCIGSYMRYRGKKRHLGTLGNAGAFSFHGTKNVAAGEGGALVTNNDDLFDKLEILRAIGTDRAAFLAGKVSIYRWVGEGSSYMLTDLLATLVNTQIDQIKEINLLRKSIADMYTQEILQFEFVQLPCVPPEMIEPNWHIYALKFDSADRCKNFIAGMREKGIEVSMHYVPLHSSPMGKKLGGAKRKLPMTDDVAATIVRLPIFAGMTELQLEYINTHAVRILKKLQ